MMILYLHGFRSSPSSLKARLMAQTMATRGLQAQWQCPQLPASPRAALTLAETVARAQIAKVAGSGVATPAQALTLIGSSLGGYYATWLAERLGCKAVLLNPVVHPVSTLAKHAGHIHRMCHSDAPFVLRPEYVDEVRDFYVAAITRPHRYFLIAATGDELLDWHEMRDHYAGCRQRIVQGSDHGLTDFEKWLPEVMEFALGSPR
jgi:predicted esterase YcpF (UPF0227 family)